MELGCCKVGARGGLELGQPQGEMAAEWALQVGPSIQGLGLRVPLRPESWRTHSHSGRFGSQVHHDRLCWVPEDDVADRWGPTMQDTSLPGA